jgi:hypothetical protein
LGAVGAFSSKLEFARAEPVAPVADVTIPVKLVDDSPPPGRKRVDCPDAYAAPNDRVTWEAGAGVGAIHLVIFKNRSPFGKGRQQRGVLEHRANADAAARRKLGDTIHNDAQARYDYTIVVRDNSTPPKTFALDPWLDIG